MYATNIPITVNTVSKLGTFLVGTGVIGFSLILML